MSPVCVKRLHGSCSAPGCLGLPCSSALLTASSFADESWDAPLPGSTLQALWSAVVSGG